MKRPFDSVKEIFLENIKNSKETSKFIFEHADKLMMWIVGFSIGGLSLIIVNFSDLNSKFTYCTLKSILILLIVSIILGIIYRISFYLYQVKYKQSEMVMENAFSDKELMLINAPELSETIEYKEIITRIKLDFGKDLTYLLAIYESAEPKGKAILLESLKKYYTEFGIWAKNDYEEAISFSKYVYKQAFGYSDKYIEKIFSKTFKPNSLKVYSWTSIISFSLSCVSFMAVLLVLCLNY